MLSVKESVKNEGRRQLKVHLFIFALAILIAGGSSLALLISYWGLVDKYGNTAAAIYSLVLSIAVMAFLVLAAKLIADWAIKTGRL